MAGQPSERTLGYQREESLPERRVSLLISGCALIQSFTHLNLPYHVPGLSPEWTKSLSLMW
jgi:hypothetical protein